VNQRSTIAGVVFVAAALVVVGVIVLLTRGQDDTPAVDLSGSAAGSSSSVTAAPSPTGPPPPTLEELQAEWAGEVCRARDRLTEQVTSLGSGLDVELSPDLLDSLDQQLRMRLLVVGSSANDLVTVLAGAPVEPAQIDAWVTSVTGPKDRLEETVEKTKGHLDAIGQSSGVVEGVQEAGLAISAGAEAFEAGQQLVEAVRAVYAEAETELGPAFEAAPDCRSSA